MRYYITHVKQKFDSSTVKRHLARQAGDGCPNTARHFFNSRDCTMFTKKYQEEGRKTKSHKRAEDVIPKQLTRKSRRLGSDSARFQL